MPATHSWIILVLTGVVADYCSGPGLILWDPLFPRPGMDRGTIEVKGIVLLNKGWNLDGKTVTVQVWPQGGGVVEEFKVEVKGRVWGPTSVKGLIPTDVYNIVVAVPLTDGKKKTSLVSDPGLATAR